MPKFFQLKKFAIPTIFDEFLDSRREKRKKKKKKKSVNPIQGKETINVPEDLQANSQRDNPAENGVSDPTDKPDCQNRDEQVESSSETARDEKKVEVRLIFSEKRDSETNEKQVLPPAVKLKKVGRKRKLASSEAVAASTGGPRGREALEDFRQKCGLDLSSEQISTRRLVTQIPNEHNYFVHESAKLLKIKLTQAQVIFFS